MPQPHIVFILSDQHNGSILSCAGDPYVRTPNLDMLSEKGTQFHNCHCNSPICVPSRSSMLTGLLPSQNNVYNNMQSLDSSLPTFVHSLAASGYKTVLAGRMHFTGYDQRHGFTQRLVGDLTPCFPGADNEFEVYGDLMRTSNQNPVSLIKSGWGDSAVLHYDEDVTDAACMYLENHKTEAPLFMTIGFYGPHCPYIAPKDLYDYYFNLLPELETDISEYEYLHPAIKNWFSQRDMTYQTDASIKRRIRAAYYALVELMDHHVGKIMETIGKTLGFDNTLIIYGSDHGDNIGEHGLFWKTNFYEGASRIPLIFRWDSHISAGHSSIYPVSLLDIAPTITDFGAALPLPSISGRNLKSYLTGCNDLDINHTIISQLGDIKGDAPSAMLLKGDWKLIQHCGYEIPQLFNLREDSEELHDLGNVAEYQQIVDELLIELSEYWNPDTELKRQTLALKRYDIIKKWAVSVSPPPIEEWRGDAKQNFVHS